MSELELSRGDLDAALEAAKTAEALNPALARTQTVLGYAYLTGTEVDKARSAFERAIQGDSADPLPRLGMGLAKIRDGDLEQGTCEIETAASLDFRFEDDGFKSSDWSAKLARATSPSSIFPEGSTMI